MIGRDNVPEMSFHDEVLEEKRLSLELQVYTRRWKRDLHPSKFLSQNKGCKTLINESQEEPRDIGHNGTTKRHHAQAEYQLTIKKNQSQKKDKEEKLTTIQQKKQKRCNKSTEERKEDKKVQKEDRKKDKKIRKEDRKVLQVGAEPIRIDKIRSKTWNSYVECQAGNVANTLFIDQYLKILEEDGRRALMVFGAKPADFMEAKQLLNEFSVWAYHVPVGVPTCFECPKDTLNMYNVGNPICKCLKKKYGNRNLGDTVALCDELQDLCCRCHDQESQYWHTCKEQVQQLHWHLKSLQVEGNKFFLNFTLHVSDFVLVNHIFLRYVTLLEKCLYETLSQRC